MYTPPMFKQTLATDDRPRLSLRQGLGNLIPIRKLGAAWRCWFHGSRTVGKIGELRARRRD